MIRVLDLFAGTQSVKKALTKKYEIKHWTYQKSSGIGLGYKQSHYGQSVEYMGIDIYSPEKKNVIIDLTSDFALEMIKDRLGDWHPEFIGASPTCTTGSIAAISHHGKVEYEGRNIVKRIPKTEDAINGIKMIENVKKIIDYFKVPFAIENPRGTMRKYPTFDSYYRDTAMYCQYGDTRMKPTDIGSNVQLNLKKCKNGNPCHIAAPRGSKTGTQGLKNNAERSIVPPKLIIDIMNQSLGDENEN